MVQELTVRLLGGFSLAVGGHELSGVHTVRLQALLAYLLLHRGTPHARQQLAFLFWPDTTEPQAHTNLRQLLHSLRRRLPDPDAYLEVTDKTVRWREGAQYTLDVAEFETALAGASRAEDDVRRAALERAVGTYGGDLLPGCYDDWLLAERERLAHRFLDALEQLILLLEQRREYALALDLGLRLLRQDPLHEAAYRCLMRLHAANGDRAAALRVYHTCATLLERELGVPPGAATVEAYQRLLNLEHEAPAPPGPVAVEPGNDLLEPVRGAAPARIPYGPAHLVGRQAEMETLQDLWRTAQRRGTHLACLSGEAGIGKTRLAEEMMYWVRQQGKAAAATRAYAGAYSLAYAPLVELLRSAALRPRVAALPAIWRSELARLLPELTVEDPGLPRPEPLAERWQVQRMYDAVGGVLVSSDPPLLLLLDDLQWFDTETVTWLRYLLWPAAGEADQAKQGSGLLLLAALRPEELADDHPVMRLLLELRCGEHLTELNLAPLSAEETAELAAGAGLDAAGAEAVYRSTGGNPLFVIETVRAGLEAGAAPAPRLPPKVQAVIHLRLAQLSPPALELAGLAAAIGRSFPYDVLAKASYRDEDTLVRTLDELWRRRIIREQGAGAYDFSHDRIRDVAYEGVSSAQRRLYHRRIAEALEALHGDPDAVGGELAAHYEHAGLVPKAIHYRQQAAAAARRAFANEDAVHHLSEGLRLLQSLPQTPERDQQELSLQIGLSAALAAARSNTAPEVEAAYRRAEELAQAVGEPPELFPARWGRWSSQFSMGEQRAARQIGEELLSSAVKYGDPDLILQGHHALWTSSFASGDFPAALLHVEEGRAIYRPDTHHAQLYVYGGHDAEICGLSYAIPSEWMLGYPDRALDTARMTLDLAAQSRRPSTPVQPLYWSAVLHQLRGDVPAVRLQAEKAGHLSRLYGVMTWHSWDACLLGWATAAEGQVTAGIEQMQHGLQGREARRGGLLLTYFMAGLAEVQGQAGQAEDGLRTLETSMAEAQRTGELWWSAEMHRLRGDLLLERLGATDEAEQSYLRALEIARQQQARSLELRAATALCRLWLRQGRKAQAYELLSEIYGWFAEGFDTHDLKEAKALVEELST